METPKPTTQNKKEDKKGGVPTLSDATQTLRNPAFKVKDLSSRTLVERFKQFRKKDLAFILAGLGVLFTAPMAERYLMSPTNGSSDVFKEGWGFRPGQGGLGAGGSPFDTGENGFATGNQVGENGDIITPANFRDPSSLILGPEAEAQPPATTSEAPAPSSGGSNWKNALAEAGSGAARKALGRAGLPMPPLTLSKNMLSGLVGLSPQGGGEHYSLPPVGGGHVPNSPNVSNSLGAVKANPNLKGVGPWSETGNGSGSIEALKTAGGNAASQFSNPSAAKGLNNAAAVQMPTANPNRFGSAGADKGLGNNSVKMSKNLGQSLAFMAAKMNMQKAIDLQWKLAEKKAMMWPNIEEKMLTDMVTKPLGAVEDALGQGIAGFLGGPSADHYHCSSNGQDYSALTCSDAASGGPKAPASGWCFYQGAIYSGGKDTGITQIASGCTKSGGSSGNTNPPGTAASSMHSIDQIAQQCQGVTAASINGNGTNVTGNLDQMNQTCSALKDAIKQEKSANQTMGTPSSSNYDVRKSPVRGFVLNPIHSLLWTFAGQIFNATAHAQQTTPTCPSVSSCLKKAQGEILLELSDIKGALGKVQSEYGNKCRSYMQTVGEACNQSAINKDTEKSIGDAIKGMQSTCYPLIKKEIGKDSRGVKAMEKHNANAKYDINQADNFLSNVKSNFESQINTDENEAKDAASLIKSKRNKAAFSGYAAQIGRIHDYVRGERRSLKTCHDKLKALQSDVSSNLLKPVENDYKLLRWMLSNQAQSRPTGAPPADVTASVLAPQPDNIAKGLSDNMDSPGTTSTAYQSFNNDACKFHGHIDKEFKNLLKARGSAGVAYSSAEKYQCPASVAIAGQTAAQ